MKSMKSWRVTSAILTVCAAGLAACYSGPDGPTPGKQRVFANPAGTILVTGSTNPGTSPTNAAGNAGAVDAGLQDAEVANVDAGAGFCAQLEVCAPNEVFAPNLCRCVPAETSGVDTTP